MAEIQVWVAWHKNTPEYESLLDSQERERANRFKFPIHRERFIFAHGTLRQILGPEVTFSYTQHGKPYIAGSDVQFNMSHSEDCVVIAVTRGHKVGVDVERIRPVSDAAAIAEKHFTPKERELMTSERMFFVNWTRKEAYIKAVGHGLSMPLNSFDTSSPGKCGEWWLSDLDVASDEYAAAIVVEGDEPVILRATP